MAFITDASYIFFIESSGFCTLDCHYCPIKPDDKTAPSLTADDLLFLHDKLKTKLLLLFSGKGDFFAGYKKNDRLLSRILERDIDITLDINGVILHEFNELTQQQYARIKFVNIAMHYSQMKTKNVLPIWKKNAGDILGRIDRPRTMIEYVLSLEDINQWEEALEYYKNAIFTLWNHKITLVLDQFGTLKSDSPEVLRLRSKFKEIIADTRSYDFSKNINNYSFVNCPAGVRYFGITTDGVIMGCPYKKHLGICGNLKERTFNPAAKEYTKCLTPRYCYCIPLEKLSLFT